MTPDRSGRPHRVLVASHTSPITSAFRVGSHHYARQLAERGWNVTHACVAHKPHRLAAHTGRFGLLPALRRGVVDEDELPYRAIDLATLAPPYLRDGPRVGMRRSIAALVGPNGVPFDAVIFDHPAYQALWRSVPSDTIVYRPSDDHVAWASARSLALAAATARAEDAAAKAAAFVLPTSHEIERSITQRNPSIGRMEVITNGVDDAFVECCRSWPDRERHGIVYVGAVDDRLDVRLLERLDRQRNDLFVAGPGSAGRFTRGLGALPYDQLPALLTGCRVGLLPFSDHPGNRSRSPMKLFEYLAAGLTVVARRLPWSDRVVAEYPDLPVFTYERGGEVDAAIEAALTTTLRPFVPPREYVSAKVQRIETLLDSRKP